MDDPYEIRREAERLIGEDRVPTSTLKEIIEQHGDTPTGEPGVYLVIEDSAIALTEKGEIVETVEWAEGKPDWTHAGICDPRGTSFEAFGHLVSAMEHAEKNYKAIFSAKPARLPD